MLELLGLRSEIKTYIGDPQYISSPCLIERINNATLEVVDREEVSYLHKVNCLVLGY